MSTYSVNDAPETHTPETHAPETHAPEQPSRRHSIPSKIKKRRTLKRNDSVLRLVSRRMSKTIMPTIQNIPRVRYIFSKDSIRGDGPKTAGCIIHSSSVFRVAWDTMLFLLLMYICVLTPYRIGFDQHPSNFTPWWWVELYIDITFIIDVVLNFRTTYYQVDGREIYDGKSIAMGARFG
jgi:hypothetical protein